MDIFIILIQLNDWLWHPAWQCLLCNRSFSLGCSNPLPTADLLFNNKLCLYKKALKENRWATDFHADCDFYLASSKVGIQSSADLVGLCHLQVPRSVPIWGHCIPYLDSDADSQSVLFDNVRFQSVFPPYETYPLATKHKHWARTRSQV